MSKHLVTVLYTKVCGSMPRKAILLAMAERANDDGSMVWISKSRLALEVECSRQTVITTIKDFEKEGLVKAVDRKQGKHGYTIVYQISVRAVIGLPDWPKPGEDSLDPALLEGDELDEAVSKYGHRTGAPMSKQGGADVNVIGKNRPYRTKNITPSDSKKASPPPKRTSSYVSWEANRIRSTDPDLAKELDAEAEELARAEIAAERAKVNV